MPLAETITPRAAFPTELARLDDGVAPLDEPGRLAVALLNAGGKVAARQCLDDRRHATYLPDAPTAGHWQITFSTVPAGYRLGVGLFAHSDNAAWLPANLPHGLERLQEEASGGIN